MSTAVTLSASTGLVQLPLAYPLANGLVLEGAMLGFEEIGPRDGPAVVVLGGISAGRHVAGWWSPFVGSRLAIDTDDLRVLGVDYLGGVGASSGPESTGLGASFPQVEAADQARAIVCLLDHLGIERLRAVVGSSYGGQVALALAAEFPDRLEHAVVIAAAHRSHPLARAWRHVQRGILDLGIASGRDAQAVALARELAMTTYRTPEELLTRFGDDAEGLTGWLQSCGRAFASRFDAASYRVLSSAIDRSRVEPERIVVRTTLVAFVGDRLVPVELSRELRARLAGPVELFELPSLFGHDGFLKEVTALSKVLRGALEVTS